MTLKDPNRSPTAKYGTKIIVTQPEFERSLKDADNFSMNDKDNYDELYSPATESILLSPDITGNSFVNHYESSVGDKERINVDIYCYGRLIFFIKIDYGYDNAYFYITLIDYISSFVAKKQPLFLFMRK